MESTIVSINEAASKLGISPQQVRNLCRSGKIECMRVGSTWAVDEAQLENFYFSSRHSVVEDQPKISRPVMKSEKKPIALSFFSGAMGLDLGIEKAGFEILLCCENDQACRKTIISNKPDVALIGDLNSYSASEIRKSAGLLPNDEIDLIVGGPPCQAFSTAGRRKGFEDARGNVFLTFIDRIIELRPKFAVIENVRGILSAPLKPRPYNQKGDKPLKPEEKKGGALAYVLKKLSSAGYGVTFNLYNAANFGTPQKRERVVIVCSRDGEELPYLVPTHSEYGNHNLPKWKSFKEAVAGLEYTKHHHLEFPEKRLQYYRLLKPGQYWRHLPLEMQKKAMGMSYYSGGGKTGFLRRLSWDKPSPTLVTHPAMPATDLAHPVENRPLSIEEYKRLQQFPDDWKIQGSLIDQYRQIGNAVPVGLGHAVGKLIMAHMKGKDIPVYDKFKYSRYANTNEITWRKNVMPDLFKN